MSEAVGSYFKTLRQIKGISQEAVGRILHVSSKQVSNWERGIHVPAAHAMGMLFQTLGGSFQDVFDLLSNTDTTARDGQLLAEQALVPHNVLAHRLGKSKAAIAAYLTVFLNSLNLDNALIASSLQIPVDDLEQIKSGHLAVTADLIVALVSQFQVPFADLAFLWSALFPTAEEGASRARAAIDPASAPEQPSSHARLQSPSAAAQQPSSAKAEPLFVPAPPSSGQADGAYTAYSEAIQAINDIYQSKPQDLSRIVDILAVMRK